MLLLSCMSCLYILEIRPFLFSSFTSVFSQSGGCLALFFSLKYSWFIMLCFRCTTKWFIHTHTHTHTHTHLFERKIWQWLRNLTEDETESKFSPRTELFWNLLKREFRAIRVGRMSTCAKGPPPICSGRVCLNVFPKEWEYHGPGIHHSVVDYRQLIVGWNLLGT